MRPMLLIVLAAIAGIVCVNGFFTVAETQQAMVLTLGKVDRVVAEPGLNFKMPFYQQVIYFDKRILETDSDPEEVQSVDKKRVVVDSFTRWRIVDAEAFYKAVRNQSTAVNRIDTIVNSNIRRVVARETLEELVSGERTRLMEEIQKESGKQAGPLGIEIVDVRIKRADLPQANASAVFQRMRTEREKEAKEIRANGAEEAQKIRADANKQRTILLAEAERDAQKLRGEGEAKSIKITGEAFSKDSSFYSFLRSLEAYTESLKSGTTMVLDSSVEFMDVFSGK
ncbi:MAG: protease modulator HflC [Alphaproteobacteria bacterium]|nr:protease modulator HflC [Alphaproteobacteria bacterium]MDD9919095.1 protease modulator HflC [Alphaproteobacteria bacterium]